MEATGSFFDPRTSLDWSDFPDLPFSSKFVDHNVQAAYVPDDRGGRLYVVFACTQECKFCFCSLGKYPIKWHSDLSFVYKPSVIRDYTLTVYGMELVVIGGNFMGRPIELVQSLSSMQNEWKELPSMLTPRSSVVAVGYRDHLVAAGGKCGNKECSEVEIFNGEEWKKVKQLPCPLSSNITSVLNADKKWYIVETNGGSFRATYGAPIEDVISSSSTCEWKEYSRPPPGKLPPVSFDGQLVVVGNNGDHKKAKLYFHSPVTNSWVSFENAPYIGPYCNVVGIASLPHKKALALVYKGSENYAVKVVTHDHKAGSQLHVLDQHLSLSALIKLEYGHKIRVLSQLTPFKRRQLKQKAVFNLKPLSEEDKRMGTSDPVVNFYIESWLQDKSAGCRPTWGNFLVILRAIGMEDVAMEICDLFSIAPITITPNIGYHTVSEELLKLQGSLVSLKCACENSEVKEENQKIILPVIDRSLTESCSVAWAARYAKHETVKRNESLLQRKKALLESVNELQRKVEQEQRRIEQQKALDEKLTAEEHLCRLKTALEQVGLRMPSQVCREMGDSMDHCIKLCDIVRKKFADENKLLEERIQHLEDELLKCQSNGSTDGDNSSTITPLTEQHIPSLLRQLRNRAAKWRDIGTHLGFLPSELDNIEAQPNLMHGAPRSYFGAMLQGWTQWAPEDSRGSTNFANMEDLKDALDEAGLAATAHSLKV